MNKDQNFFILGAARSGIAAARLLRHYGAKVFVSELKIIPDNIKSILKSENIEFEENGHNIQKLCKEFNILVISPGIPLSSECILEAKKHGLRVMSEIELALQFLNPDTLLCGITGTNGKSTTTHYLTHLLNSHHIKSYACGNIGRPLSSVLLEHNDYKALCIELSSYQLEHEISKRFHATIFLNLQNDHLIRHKNIENYLRAKWNLVLATLDHGLSVMDESVLKCAQKFHLPLPKCKIEFCHNQTFQISNPCLIGEHNAKNIYAASLAAMHIGTPKNIIISEWEKSSSNYLPLAHRLEMIPAKNKIFINDSKATNVESTVVALKSLPSHLHLLLGGEPKGDSYLPISQFLGKNVIRLYPFGKAASKICEELHEFSSFLETPSHDMISACQKAFQKSRAGDTILLSPACSSFDEFHDFEHRGNVFKSWVNSTSEENTHDT